MRPQCAIVLAAAIALADTDISAATHVKPSQGGNASTNRLLRSETSATSADVDGEERGWSSIFSGSRSSKGEVLGITAEESYKQIIEFFKTHTADNNLENFLTKHFDEWTKMVAKHGEDYRYDYPRAPMPYDAVLVKYGLKNIMNVVSPKHDLGKVLMYTWSSENYSFEDVKYLGEQNVKKSKALRWAKAYKFFFPAKCKEENKSR
ncbi:hypothetical protein KXD40_003680 [Peronospora effusa]|uniref:RxLR effector protein n=1 Tax=Peronospora effusa TaxID=542832 RepID=A0A3M6V9C9_9STRA|nr:hypothetical protein DD238_007763 [Peronospora effusa]RQM11273.1 hypothetical protein DD237_007981 [Peronospora effusa]UIZ22708.1 hypothetical protein KXD40_003680 [Peronospora effusa]